MPSVTLSSIVSSLSGSNLTGGVGGPLGVLYENKYQNVNYHYPRNLATDSTRKHWIGFTILEPDPTYANNVKGDFNNNYAMMSNEDADVAAGTDQLDSALPIIETAKTAGRALDALIQTVAKSDVKRKPRSYIALYVPDTVNVNYGAGYDDSLSLSAALGSPYYAAQAGSSVIDAFKKMGTDYSVGNIINAIGSDPFLRQAVGGIVNDNGAKRGKEGSNAFSGLGIQGGDVSNLLLRGIGQAVNPQLQVLFKGIGFRTFQFDFTMTPYSKLEADMIKEIIFQFKYAAAPEINRNGVFGTQGMFFKVPDMFDIQFYYEGKINKNVHKITRCVLENVSVDYAPIGWATYDEGEPVQTKLSLQFKEIEIVDKTRIKDGY
jgi:hypothetical protein